MSGINIKILLRNYLLIIAGTALVAFAAASVLEPASLVTGGFTGLAIIIKQYSEHLVPGGIPLSFTNLALNIPFFLIAIRLKGFRYLVHTLFATLMLSFWLSVLPVVPLAGDDLLLASLYGGILMGVGIGLVFATGATTGGTDMIAALIQHFLRHYSISNILWVIDTVIVLVGVYLYGIQITLYAIIAIYLTSKISDGIIDGLKFSKAAFIITSNPERLATLVMEELGRGVTGISATGMYSGDSKNMLLCVVSKKEIVRLKELAKSCDPNAFIIVTDVREVLGEGFIEHPGNAGVL